MVIPIPDGNDTVMELFPPSSMKEDRVVILSPTEVKLSETSVPPSVMVNDPVLRSALTCIQK